MEVDTAQIVTSNGPQRTTIIYNDDTDVRLIRNGTPVIDHLKVISGNGQLTSTPIPDGDNNSRIKDRHSSGASGRMRVTFSRTSDLHASQMDDDDLAPKAFLRAPQTIPNRDNPFKPDGSLRKEADLMLRSSTISRTKVIIHDPSMDNIADANNSLASPVPVSEDGIVVETVTKAESTPQNFASPKNKGDGPQSKDSNNAVAVVSPMAVEVKLSHLPEDKGSAPETVTLEKDKKKCCNIL